VFYLRGDHVTNLSIRVYGFLTGLGRREEGQDLIEYALIGGLVAVAVIAAFALLGGSTGPVAAMIDNIGDCIDFESGTACDIDI
jgi:Flp pilus assembly pilin Flp